MRVPLLILGVAFATCALAQQKPAITEAAAKEAFRRLPKVKLGIPLPRFWSDLGLSGYRQPSSGRGSGPTTEFRMNFELTPKYRIAVVMDCTKRPPIVTGAQAVKMSP